MTLPTQAAQDMAHQLNMTHVVLTLVETMAEMYADLSLMEARIQMLEQLGTHHNQEGTT